MHLSVLQALHIQVAGTCLRSYYVITKLSCPLCADLRSTCGPTAVLRLVGKFSGGEAADLAVTVRPEPRLSFLFNRHGSVTASHFRKLPDFILGASQGG